MVQSRQVVTRVVLAIGMVVLLGVGSAVARGDWDDNGTCELPDIEEIVCDLKDPVCQKSKWVEVAEHCWYLHEFTGLSLEQLKEICGGDNGNGGCEGNCGETCGESCGASCSSTCAAECRAEASAACKAACKGNGNGNQSCPSLEDIAAVCAAECKGVKDTCAPPFNDLATGLYALAWDCQERGLQLQFRQSSRGWTAKCRKKVRVQLPLELEEIRETLR